MKGVEEEEVRRFARMVGAWARVEHEERRLRPLGPWREGLDGELQVAAGLNGLVHLRRISPRNGQGPVALPVVADGLLKKAGLVGVRRLHQVARGLHAVHGREYGIHGVKVMEGHQRNFWMG